MKENKIAVIGLSGESIFMKMDHFNQEGETVVANAYHVEYGGKGINPWGVEVYGFEGKAKIDREQFGLTWNAALETGGVLVGKDIKIKVELELNPAQ